MGRAVEAWAQGGSVVNITTRRYPRSMSDAFPCERYSACTRYRAPLLHRAWHTVAQLLFVVVVFGGLGALLAWGGRGWL